MSMAQIRKSRGVPAKRGMRVKVDGKMGVITSATCYIWVRFDGDKFSVPCHPTWRVTYYDKYGSVLKQCDD